ncbi:MAG: sigma-70 family RNA polymerase sigma factor [Candidatus Hydrogenedentes bacterium]|nr:sigma-70 family RNA polymerase sigma factor [Candidatus Hydrogenedentota bacterium]
MQLRALLLECILVPASGDADSTRQTEAHAAWRQFVEFIQPIVAGAGARFPGPVREQLLSAILLRIAQNPQRVMAILLEVFDGAGDDGESAVRRYLYTVALNLARDLLRKETRESAKEAGPREPARIPEEFELLKQLVAKLDIRQQCLFRLVYFGRSFEFDLEEAHWSYLEKQSGLSRTEIARQLGASVNENGAKRHLVTSELIAALMGTTPENVDQMRSRMRSHLRGRLERERTRRNAGGGT